MRTITDHKVNGLNEALTVIATDAPGPGGANHKYTLLLQTNPDSSARQEAKALHIEFQNGPIGEAGFNGFSNEALLAVLIDRMRGFQFLRNGTGSGDFNFKAPGPYACRENELALVHLEAALMWLQKRTRDRMARGVEGTHKV